MSQPAPRAAPTAKAQRAEQVRATRHKVLSAARELFLRRGYVGTTIEAVAHRAQVSPQTVYNVIGAKAALFKAVYDVALAGDDEPVPIQRRAPLEQIRAAPDARTALALYARLGRQMYTRAGPLIAGLVVEGTGGDRTLQAFVRTIERERRTGNAAMAQHIATRFGLRPGLTEAEAADVLWALTAPELIDRLVRRRRWSLDSYETWLTRTLTEALTGPTPG